METFAKNWFVS